MGLDSEDTVSAFRPPPFVEVSVAGGELRRFAAGTKASFAIHRINSRSEAAEMSNPYSFITAVKEGEEAVEFGPDAELVSYGEGWKLQALQDVKFVKSSQLASTSYGGGSKVEAKDEMKAVSQPVRKWYLSPPEVEPCRPPRDGHPPQIASSLYALGHSKGGRAELPDLDKKDAMALQRRSVVNWPQYPSPKLCWPPETDSGVSSKQRREKNFVSANPEKKHTILTRIYCPSLSPAKQCFYNEFNPADYYPGGKLPEHSPPKDGWAYFWNMSSVVGLIFLGCAFWVYLLENQFFLGA